MICNIPDYFNPLLAPPDATLEAEMPLGVGILLSILTGYLVGTSLWWGWGQPFSCEKLGFKVTLKNGPRTLGFSQQPLSLLTLALPCEKPERSLMGADPLTQYISFIFPLSYYSTCTLLKFPVSTVPCVSVFLLLFHILMTFFRV